LWAVVAVVVGTSAVIGVIAVGNAQLLEVRSSKGRALPQALVAQSRGGVEWISSAPLAMPSEAPHEVANPAPSPAHVQSTGYQSLKSKIDPIMQASGYQTLRATDGGSGDLGSNAVDYQTDNGGMLEVRQQQLDRAVQLGTITQNSPTDSLESMPDGTQLVVVRHAPRSFLEIVYVRQTGVMTIVSANGVPGKDIAVPLSEHALRTLVQELLNRGV